MLLAGAVLIVAAASVVLAVMEEIGAVGFVEIAVDTVRKAVLVPVLMLVLVPVIVLVMLVLVPVLVLVLVLVSVLVLMVLVLVPVIDVLVVVAVAVDVVVVVQSPSSSNEAAVPSQPTQRRSELSVGATDSYSPALQIVYGVHSRSSSPEAGAFDSHSLCPQAVWVPHTVFDVAVGGCLTYCVSAHGMCVAQLVDVWLFCD